jgi:hypothetical protein
VKDRLIEFLTVLDKDDALKQRYFADQKGTAEAFGLEPEDVTILLNHDVDAIKKRAEAEGAAVLNIGLAQ